MLAFAGLVFWDWCCRHRPLVHASRDPGWFDGSLWWVAVTAGAGLIVGVLRRFLHVPDKVPGTVEMIKEQRVEPSMVPGAVAVSLVSLAGGASLGPEDALGKIGGGLGTWISERRKLGEDVRATNTLSGMSAAYGGCCRLRSWRRSSPSRSRVRGDTLRRHPGRGPAGRLGRVRACTFRSRGRLRRALALPPYEYEDWQMLAAIPLGLAAGALALITVVAIGP